MTGRWVDLIGIDPDYTKDAAKEVLIPAPGTPGYEALVGRIRDEAREILGAPFEDTPDLALVRAILAALREVADE